MKGWLFKLWGGKRDLVLKVSVFWVVSLDMAKGTKVMQRSVQLGGTQN